MDTKKVALVTGANKGIGLEIARQLSQKGWHVFVGARNREAGEAAAQQLRAAGGDAQFVELDVANLESIRRAAQQVEAASGRLDALINNAGIVGEGDDSILDTDGALLEDTLRTNTFGPLLVAQALLPLLRRSEAGRIVNVSSGAGSLTDMDGWAPAYSISKTALNAVTRLLSLALKDEGIAVNSMCPGWVRTDMGGANATRSVEQGADTAVWLAGEAPQSLTGQFLRDRKPIAW